MTNNLVAGIIRKITNARRKAFEKTLPKGMTVEHVINEEVKKLKKYLIFLENCLDFIVNTETAVGYKINEIETNTKQDIDKERLTKEIWILRYTYLYFLFFEIKPPKNENEVVENDKLIAHALQNILNKKGKDNYLTWIMEGFSIFSKTPEINYKNLKKFESHFAERVAERIPLIAFECTGGRLGGEQHDSILELIMTTIEKDKNFFHTGNDILTEEEARDIKKVIGEMQLSREGAAKDFFHSLGVDIK